jgi:hypothetical protein
MWQPLSAKGGINFADKMRTLSQYSWLADSDQEVLVEIFKGDRDKFSIGTLRDGVKEEDLRGHGGEQ